MMKREKYYKKMLLTGIGTILQYQKYKITFYINGEEKTNIIVYQSQLESFKDIISTLVRKCRDDKYNVQFNCEKLIE